MDYDTRLQHASATRLAVCAALGIPSTDVLAPLIDRECMVAKGGA